jgi:hypothetical protein
VTEQARRAERRSELLDERERLSRLRERSAPWRARRTRAHLVQRLNRLAS